MDNIRFEVDYSLKRAEGEEIPFQLRIKEQRQTWSTTYRKSRIRSLKEISLWSDGSPPNRYQDPLSALHDLSHEDGPEAEPTYG